MSVDDRKQKSCKFCCIFCNNTQRCGLDVKSENSRRISILKNITEASKVQYTSDTGYF